MAIRVVVAARTQAEVEAVAREVGGRALELDVASPASVEHAFAAAGRLDLLVNNAGSAWRGRFGEAGWENVRRHMELNFDAVVRLTEALLPLLRRSAPSSIVNVSSTSGRVARGNAGGYSASKFAIAGWSDALHLEEAAHGVHVGLVLPGFITTEGFPQRELRESARTRWLVSTPDKVADAIFAAGPGGKAERYVPRGYALAAALRTLAPGLTRRVLGGGGSAAMTPATGHGDS